MPPRRQLQRSSVFNKNELLTQFRSRRIKEIHAWNLWSYLIRNPGSSWKDVPDFPKAASLLLEENFAQSTIKVIQRTIAEDNETTKLLLKLQDGLQIETVIMNYDTRGRIAPDPLDEALVLGNQRYTVCVSSQVGCRMGCKFCATGTMGLNGNLTSGEIVEQVLIAQRQTNIRNVVFMGMGEPLDNYDSVKDAVSMLIDTKGFGLAKRRITISTVGVHNKFQLLAKDLPGVSLAFSLHAPTQELREQIVPSAKAYKLDVLMKALETYQRMTKQRVFIEYVLLANVNDSDTEAHQIGVLLSGKDIVLNLIPFNPVYAPGMEFKAPKMEVAMRFQSIVMDSYGIRCTIRQEKGQEIAGACGQLAVVSGRTRGSHSAAAALPDLEDTVR